MTPEQQKQFNQELQMVVAVAAQIRPCYDRSESAVLGAMELIQAAERLLKGHYEQPKTVEDRPEPPVAQAVQPRPSRKVVEDSISVASRIILEKKLRTQMQLEEMLKAYGVKTKSQLTDEQAIELMDKLKFITKEK